MGKVDECWIGHRIMGHIKFDNLVNISKGQAIRDTPKITKPSNFVCTHCLDGKKQGTRISFKEKQYSTTKPFVRGNLGLKWAL